MIIGHAFSAVSSFSLRVVIDHCSTYKSQLAFIYSSLLPFTEKTFFLSRKTDAFFLKKTEIIKSLFS